jgi:hypothetical protein
MTGALVVILILDLVLPNLPFFGPQSRQGLAVELFFVVEVLICAVIQASYLIIIKGKYELNPTVGHFRKYVNTIFYGVSVAQLIIISLLIAITLEVKFFSQYYTSLLLASILLSLSLSATLSAFLAFRFLLWIRYKGDYQIIAYTSAAILISINSVFIASLMWLEIQGRTLIVDPSILSSNLQPTNYDLHQLQSIISIASFIMLWVASAFLLRRHRRKWGMIKFCVVISLPLLYYLGVIQFVFTYVLTHYDIFSPVQSYTFNLINSSLTRPVGGVLFGVAFWMVGMGVTDKNIRDYMKMSAVGIMLISISNQDAGLSLLPYPPFGLPTITFAGISSYLLFVGIYYSSVSISINTELRKNIESAVDQQFRFVSKLGKYEMENEIQNRVKGVTRKLAKVLEENSGIEASLENKDIEDYVKLVLVEKENMMKNTNSKDKSRDSYQSD